MIGSKVSQLAFAFLALLSVAACASTCPNTSFSTTSQATYDGNWTYHFDKEDGQAAPTGAITPENYYVYVTLPFDPLKVGGCVPSYGSNASALTGIVSSFTETYGPLHGRSVQWFTLTWAFGQIPDGNYTWTGTYTVTWTCTRFSTRYNECSVYTPGEGLGVMTHN